jgi:hypothetical protein
MTDQLVTQTEAQIIESVVIGGDLSKLTPTQRVNYYRQVCASLNLNPLTKPFDYITLNNKLTLYAKKDCTDQVRRNNSISITKLERERIEDAYVVTAYAQDKTGRTDSSIGVVSIKGLAGDALANAMMKGETKAKRRVTLSICGLGMMDESELETTPAQRVIVAETGEIVEPKPIPIHTPDADPSKVKPITKSEPAAASMTIEFAEAEYSETRKCSYGQLTNEELSNMANALTKVAKRGENQERKLQASKMILAARQKGRSIIAMTAAEFEPEEPPEQGELI